MSALLRLLSFLPQFFPPYFSWGYLHALLTPISETIEMAFGALLIALFVGIGSSFWIAARLPGSRAVYALLASFRSIPDLTLAILCVVVVGLGPAAGMLALAIFYSSAIGKIFTDLFLSADQEPLDALRATGAAPFSVVLFGHLPLRLKDIISYGVYEFESAVRASVIVGAVGGGGIGTEIVGTINQIDYRRTTTLILALIVVVACIDKFGQWVKHVPRVIWMVLPLMAFAAWLERPTMLALSHAASTFAGMFPPSLPPEAVRKVPELLLETFGMAAGGTFFAAIAAVPLAFCAARNISPAYITIPTRRFLEAVRAVPEIVWGLLLVTTIGVGPQAGMVALALHTSGTLGRLFAESFENVPTAPIDAIASTGARKLAILAFAFIPLALAPMAIHILFRLEWNIRAATVVGVIGAGGIGEALFNAQQSFFYQQMLAYLGITWMLVLAADQASGVFRPRMRLLEVLE